MPLPRHFCNNLPNHKQEQCSEDVWSRNCLPWQQQLHTTNKLRMFFFFTWLSDLFIYLVCLGIWINMIKCQIQLFHKWLKWRIFNISYSFYIIMLCQLSEYQIASVVSVFWTLLDMLIRNTLCSISKDVVYAVCFETETRAHFILTAVWVNSLCVRFVLDAVQVFMQPIQQESHELLSIMLRIACKLTGLTGNYSLCREMKQHPLIMSCLITYGKLEDMI